MEKEINKILKKYDVKYFDGSTYAVSEEFENDLIKLFNNARNFGYNEGVKEENNRIQEEYDLLCGENPTTSYDTLFKLALKR